MITTKSIRGRPLAVALAYQGLRLGGALLWDAVERASRSEVAVYALVVDAKDEQPKSFYLHHGFLAFGEPVCVKRVLLPEPRGCIVDHWIAVILLGWRRMSAPA